MSIPLLFLVWAGLSIYMLLATDILTYSLGRVGWMRFASTFLLFCAQVITTEFALGLFSLLGSLGLTLTNLAISTLLIVLVRRKHSSKLFSNYRKSWVKTLSASWQTLRTDPLWFVLLGLGALILLWVIFLGIIFPGLDWDGNSYHLTFIGYVIQNHNFFDVPTSLHWLTGYPKGGEFMEMWSVIISHNDMISDLTQVPFVFLGCYALYSITKAIGANSRQARFSAILFLFLPIVINQLKTTYVDVILCSVFFAAIAVVLEKRLGKLELLILGIAFSLVISIKSSGFLFIAVLIPLLIWNLYRNRHRPTQKFIDDYLKPLGLVALPTVFGIYWYIKDYVLYGSPIYPFGYKLDGIKIFPGQTFQNLAASSINQLPYLPHGYLQRLWFVWTEQHDWYGCFYNYDSNYTGFGPIWFVLLLPAIAVSLYLAIKKRNVLFLAITATLGALFLLYPADFYTRYTIFITAVGIYAFGYVLTNINKYVALAVKALAIVLTLVVLSTNFVLCNYTPMTIKAQLKSLSPSDPRGSVYANLPGKAFVFIEARVKPGEVVAYDSSPYFIYPLWTSNFSDRVIYIPSSNSTEWFKTLATQHVRYVFTTVGSKENLWAKGKLPLIYKDQTYEIYEVY